LEFAIMRKSRLARPSLHSHLRTPDFWLWHGRSERNCATQPTPSVREVRRPQVFCGGNYRGNGAGGSSSWGRRPSFFQTPPSFDNWLSLPFFPPSTRYLSCPQIVIAPTLVRWFYQFANSFNP
jgi:hypothetical protein